MEQKSDEGLSNGNPSKDLSVRLSVQRTTLSFQRTRLAADRTLMSIIRTALSLIGFGFTIFKFFRSVKEITKHKVDPAALAGEVGLSMVGLGIGILFLGIIYHILFMLQVRKERQRLDKDQLIDSHDEFPISMTLVIAILLLLLGLYIIFKMILDVGS
jgi:putative membrane protein